MLDDLIVIDFETEAIAGNPLLTPPRPVGVALSMPGEPPKYMGWAHPQGNNCTAQEASEVLGRIARSRAPLLFHNAGFDISVWQQWIPGGLDFTWERIHDTMFLLFLADPYSSTLSLKPSAERYLGLAAREQSELHEWILAHIPGSTPRTAGAYIALAPGDLVGRYAIGDVSRTRDLFNQLHKRIKEDGMEAAYDRERRLFPIVLAGTRRGIRIDREALAESERAYTRCLDDSSQRLADLIGASVDVLDHSEQFCDALERSGAVTEWTYTKTGRRSTAKDNIHITNPQVRELYQYRGALATCLQTFIRPWLEFSAATGRLHPNWNQVKQYREGGSIYDKKGTQTGRLSSDSPNFQNVPTEFKDALGNPLPTPPGLLPLPLMRRYCLPEEGHVWLKRDFSSQEIRILAHFEDGRLCEAYRANPNLDPHEMARQLINTLIGVLYDRKAIKITGFSLIYGTGVNGLSIQLGRPYSEAAAIKTAYLGAMPDVRDLMQSVQSRGRSGGYIRTWGGRIYYAEPPRVVEGRVRDFAYKLLNYLIQGSAADQTKEAIIHWDGAREEEAIFLATVHDEINISAPVETWQRHMATLKTSMNLDRFDVPMLSEGFYGPNWADLKECE